MGAMNRPLEKSDTTTAPREGAGFGRYYLVRKIGHGGMAEVFLGHRIDDATDAPPLVIKCMLPHIATDPQFLAMFTNEAQLGAQMDHPNIVRVVDFGESDGRLYMAMEYVHGLDCWRFVRRLYPLVEDHTAIAGWIVCRVLDALAYAHAVTDVNGQPLSVVHRDLTPSNIYLSVDGQVKLGDFGIAKIDSSRYRELKMIPKGKFGYIAPEQVEGRTIDQRADIFAAGVVLAELLIGKKMFSGSSQLSVMLEIKDGRLDTLEQNVDQVDPDLLKILLQALARDPNHRFLGAADFKHALTLFLSGRDLVPTAGDLAHLVRKAMVLSDPRSSVPEHQLLETDDDAPITQRMTRKMPSSRSGGASFSGSWPPKDPNDPSAVVGKQNSAPQTGTPVTRTSTPFEDENRYSAKLADGRTVGPMSYAHIIELICADHIGPQTLIAIGNRPFVPAAQCPELVRHLPAYTPLCSANQMATPDRRGFLQLEAPSEVIVSLSLNAETGMLMCKCGEQRKEVYFRDGQVVYVSSNDPGELLGEFLVAQNALGREDLELALALLPRFNGHMGDTFIALGMLSAVELFKLIGEQIRTRFCELLSWRTGNYEFYRGVACRDDVCEVPLDVFATVTECLQKESRAIPVETTLVAMSSCLIRPTDKSEELLAQFRIPTEIRPVLKDVNEPCKLAVLISSRGDAHQKSSLVRTLFFAIETGLWHVEGPPPPWRSHKADRKSTPPHTTLDSNHP